MRTFFLLVFTITASVAFASPPVQDEKFPDQVMKVPVVEKEPTVELTEAEAGPLIEDEAVADSHMVKSDSVLLEPETTEEQRVPEETQVMLEEPVPEADRLPEEKPETELEPEPEITAEDPEIQMEPGRGSQRANTGRSACRGAAHKGKCYQYFTINYDVHHAEYHCQSTCQNGHLASVTDRDILEKLGNLMDMNGGRTRAWLGGRRIVGTKTFIWVDGTWWSYNGWAKGEPNNRGGIENCVEIWGNLEFNDEACSKRRPFFCSYPL